MDDVPAPSPASSSASDSDAYNTESARLYFGPLKTPERKFVAASQRLFPPPQPTAVRRSPRLSSPRLRSASPMDVQTTEEDMEDIERVVQLVNESDEEDGDMLNSDTSTPQMVDFLPDEPSSVLADKIIHALDNPSPPPSPPTALRIFDPYHTTTQEPTTDYQTDLMSLKINDGFEADDENPLFVSSVNAQPIPLLLSTAPSSENDTAAAQEDLISFDSFSTPPMRRNTPDDVAREGPPCPPHATLSVDDLLSQSPNIPNSPSPLPQHVPTVVVEPPESEGPALGFAMSVDKPSSPKETVAETQVPAIVLDHAVPEDERQQGDASTTNQADTQPTLAEELLTTPLRRSTRPRRSVTPIPIPPPNPPTFIAPPSPAKTQVRKKVTAAVHNEEVVSDSEDEQEDIRLSPSRATPPTTIGVRHRSPGKAPFSFRRELGSLSPTSSNLLSTLAFNASDEPGGSTDFSENQPEASSSGSQPMFSFSVFAPPNDTAGPSTPIRSTGPVRFASPPKGTSPDKYRIQTPVPGDPLNTPARRIPIAQAIAQGHVSPEKAVQLGFRPNGTPIASVPTPARRVLVSETAAPSVMKSSNLRFGSPVKVVPRQRDPSAEPRAPPAEPRERSVEPSRRPSASVKGKEKASQVSREPAAALTKLPFPLVPSTPPVEFSMSSTQGPSQDNLSKTRASPIKSSLKQATSRIPRIGAKPYARAIDSKAGEKAKATTPARMVDLAKPPPKPSIADSISISRKNVRGPQVGKGTAGSSTSRVKPTVTTSTSLLKRKRGPEKSSPVKPRVIMLRQVPQVTVTPTEPLSNTQAAPAPVTTATSKSKKPSQTPMRIRRVMDPEPATPSIVQPSPSPPTQPELTESQAATSTPPQPPTIDPSKEPSSSPRTRQTDELSPGSPMKQDPPTVSQQIPEQRPVDGPNGAAVPDNSSTSEGSSISGLRRTTRSRRTAVIQDVFTEGSSRSASTRRKASAFRSDDIFSGMSMTALKDLTISNTVRNQKYLAANLETEVIRKEGTRPESPAVKVRTIVQRQQGEKDRQRAERAKRRARRSDEMASSDIEGVSDNGYSSPVENQMSDGEAQGPLVKHTRGAGDEDDYETPEKYSRQIKRTRLFGDDSDAQEEEQPKRRVKWDRGLFTTVYLDEVRLGTRQTLKENRSLKGILAPTAKALRLDTLGNLPHADSPLADLVQENITVKKIVYDSDVIAEEVAVKTTRSKSKKK